MIYLNENMIIDDVYALLKGGWYNDGDLVIFYLVNDFDKLPYCLLSLEYILSKINNKNGVE